MEKLTAAILSVCLAALSLPAQPYLAGYGEASIEPDESLPSVALAGYGYPPEGRFSLTWQRIGFATGIKSLTGNGKELFALSESGILYKASTGLPSIEWEAIGGPASFKAVAAVGDKLFAITTDDDLSVAKLVGKRLVWKPIGGALPATKCLSSSEDRLYALSFSGDILEGTPSDEEVAWTLVGRTSGILPLALACGGGRFYCVSEDQQLWYSERGVSSEWLKTGYRNGTSYDIEVRQLTMAGGRLYAIDDDGGLSVARHKSLGDLGARTVALTLGERTVLLVSLDLTGFDHSFGEDIKNVVERKHGIPKEAVLINATHTHFAPVAQLFPTWGRHQQKPDPRYMAALRKGVIESVDLALASRRPSELSFGRGSTAIGANRSLPSEEAVRDEALDVVRISPLDGSGDIVVFIAACHPVFNTDGVACHTISPNFPSFARRAITSREGISSALFLQGCAGDVNPVDHQPAVSGRRLAEETLAVLEGVEMTPIVGGISFASDSLLFPCDVMPKGQVELLRKESGRHPGDVEAEKDVRWAEMMLGLYERGEIPERLPVYVQLVDIGPWRLVGLSREAVSEYAIQVRSLWPDRTVSVLGYTNDVASYLPDRVHIGHRTYEGYGSFFWNGQPSMMPEDIVRRVIDTIRKIEVKL